MKRGRRGGPGRVRVAGVVCLVLFVTLAGRLVHLQVAERPAYAARAEQNRMRFVDVEAPRGRILDRAGRVLADNRLAYRVSLDRSLSAAERAERLAALSTVLGRPVEELDRRLADKRPSPLLPAPLADDVSEDVVVAIRERPERFTGVVVDSHPTRRFPHGPLAAHVLGAHRKGGGSFGVELIADRRLAGRPGDDRVFVDSRGEVVRRWTERPPEPGADVTLTLDLDVQRAAETALADQMVAARKFYSAPAGAVVVLDTRDGGVAALASAPTFDPASLSARLDPAVWAGLHDPAAHAPLTNRVLQGLYAPGSTFKPVTAIAGLEAGGITARTVVNDQGVYRLGGRQLRNAQGRSHGPVDLARALAVSSDVYFYGLGERLHSGSADGSVQSVARRLGLGGPTGIDLGPEATGRVPGPDWKRAAHNQAPTVFPDGRWYPGDSVNLSIGQGDLVATPLQLAVAYAALTTGQPVPAPHVLTGPATSPAASGGTGGSLPNPFGRPAREPGPVRTGASGGAVAAAGARGIDPAHRAAVLTGLRAAVSDPKGTAHAAFDGFPLDRYPVEGKTGTAQVTGKADTSLFAAAVPAGAPRYVVVVVVEESGFGSVVAAPIARRVIEALMVAGALDP